MMTCRCTRRNGRNVTRRSKGRERLRNEQNPPCLLTKRENTVYIIYHHILSYIVTYCKWIPDGISGKFRPFP
jgi:hypothetical protein